MPYTLLAQTEARSPQPVHAKLIRDRRTAYDFFLLVKPGAKKPLALKQINWRRHNVLVVYPGLVQSDARVTFTGVSRNGRKISPSVRLQRGRSMNTRYPIFLVRVARQPANVTAGEVILSTPRIQIQLSQD